MTNEPFEYSRDAIHIADAEGALVRVNPAFLRLYRYGTERLALGIRSDQLWPAGAAREFARFRERIEAGGVWEGELSARTGDGTEILVWMTAFPLGGEDSGRGCICFSRDRTGEALMEKELFYAHRMAVLGSLVAALAQEMNTPLASILLDAGSLRDLTARGRRRSPVEKEATVSLLRCAEHLRRVVRHLQFYAQRNTLDSRSTFPVRQWIGDALLLMERQLLALRIEVSVECAPGLVVVGNRVQLESVLHGLLANARDAFTGPPRNRKIRIRCDREPGNRVMVEVRDNAGGIAPDILEWIFEPFFSTKQGRGAGLGLSIYRRIVSQLGGSLECDSSNGETRFRIRLPSRPSDGISDQGLVMNANSG